MPPADLPPDVLSVPIDTSRLAKVNGHRRKLEYEPGTTRRLLRDAVEPPSMLGSLNAVVRQNLLFTGTALPRYVRVSFRPLDVELLYVVEVIQRVGFRACH
jgi:hypothetical protein